MYNLASQARRWASNKSNCQGQRQQKETQKSVSSNRSPSWNSAIKMSVVNRYWRRRQNNVPMWSLNFQFILVVCRRWYGVYWFINKHPLIQSGERPFFICYKLKLSIYYIYWMKKTAEMRKREGTQTPSADYFFAIASFTFKKH